MFWVWIQSFENQGLSVATWSINATFSTCPMVKALVLSNCLIFLLRKKGKKKGFCLSRINPLTRSFFTLSPAVGYARQAPSIKMTTEKGYSPRQEECISIHVFRERWAWVEYQEPCCRTKMWFGPTQKTVALISCEWLKYISGISHMSGTMAQNWKHSLSLFPTYFLSLHVRHSYINKILLKFNLLIVEITIILKLYDSLQ